MDTLLVLALLLASVWTVSTARLLRSVIGLGLTSAVLAAALFRLEAPLAGVFELSVCAALVSVIFVMTVAVTQRLTKDDLSARQRQMLKRSWPIPLLVAVVAVVIFRHGTPANPFFATGISTDVRSMLWNERQLDLVGEMLVLLAGAFATVMLFKEAKK